MMAHRLQRSIATGLDLFFEGIGTILWQSVAATVVVSLGVFTLAVRFVRNHL